MSWWSSTASHRGHQLIPRDRGRGWSADTACENRRRPRRLHQPARDRRQRHRRRRRRPAAPRASPTSTSVAQSATSARPATVLRSKTSRAVNSTPGGLRAGHQLDRHDAVAAEGEERVVDADPVDAEHLGEQTSARALLHRRRRRAVRTGGRHRTPARAAPCGRACRRASAAARRSPRSPTGTMYAGQRARTRTSSSSAAVDRRAPGAGTTYDTSRSAPACSRRWPSVTAKSTLGCARECGVDLAEFDAEAADLHLEVGAADVLERVAGPARPADEVAGAVHPLAGPAERVGDEALRGQGEPVVIAAGEAGPADVQLTRDTDRDGVQPRVEHDRVGRRGWERRW